MSSVQIRDVRKSFGGFEVLHGVTVPIEDGEFVVLVGPSGCGKSTLCGWSPAWRISPRGEISIGDRVVNYVPAERARHRDGVSELRALSAYDGRRQHGLLAEAAGRQGGDQDAGSQAPRKSSTSRRCWTAFRASCPAGKASASPWAAPSCAIRRCSCSTSRSPTSTPSCACRCATRSRNCTSGSRRRLYVTHDQIEAMTMADKIVVMHDGIVEQMGTPSNSTTSPHNLFVAGFIGSPAMNFLKGKLRSNGGAGVRGAERRRAAADRRRLPVPTAGPRCMACGPSISPSPTTAPRPRSSWSSRPARKPRCSPSSAATGDRRRVPRTSSIQSGREGPAEARPALVHLFDEATGKRLNALRRKRNHSIGRKHDARLYAPRTLFRVAPPLAAAGAADRTGLFDFAKAWAQTAPWKPEAGAKLTVLRWKRFVRRKTRLS